MTRLELRLKRLESKAAPNPLAGKQSLEMFIKDGERCDVALTKALDEKGITLDSVAYITFTGDIHLRPMRDLKTHPEYERLKLMNNAKRIFQYVGVKSREELQEYRRATRSESGNPGIR